MLKEEVGSYESKYLCLVDLFDKAVAERGGETKHCENEVGSSRRDRNIDR